jgi:hypothetical protein
VHKLALLDPTDCFAGLKLSYRLHAVPILLGPTATPAGSCPNLVTAVLPATSHHTIPTEHPEHPNHALRDFLR